MFVRAVRVYIVSAIEPSADVSITTYPVGLSCTPGAAQCLSLYINVLCMYIRTDYVNYDVRVRWVIGGVIVRAVQHNMHNKDVDIFAAHSRRVQPAEVVARILLQQYHLSVASHSRGGGRWSAGSIALP